MKLIVWNINRSSQTRFRRQIEAITQEAPDILALTEVGKKAGPIAPAILREHGLPYAAFSQDVLDVDPGHSGVLLASRWPFQILEDDLAVPIKDRALSALFDTPRGKVEGHVVHVVPGSSYGWTKIEFFEAIYKRLARHCPHHRFLCGDFNSPRVEHRNGEVEVFGYKNRRGPRWHNGERSVILKLAEHDLADAYRRVNGYEADGWSHQCVRKGVLKWRRRFDHIFASGGLGAREAEYLHEYDGLSDHTPLMVGFG